jgi:hypothetical protein
MAKVTNAMTTYDAKGNREDLSNVIYNIAPYDTPIMSMLGRRNVSNVSYDWQSETLPAVNLANAEVEGFELSRAASQPTVRLSNTAQISYRDATVSGSQNNADAAGKAKEMAHQMSISSKALKRDMESILCQNQARVAGATATARKTRAFEHWLTTNTSRGASGAAAVSETAAMTDGTQRALTETLLKGVLQTAYTNGAEPTKMVVGPFNKQTVSGFAGRATARQNVSAETVAASVTLYASDFGDISIMPSRWVRPRTALLIDPEYAAVAFYRNFTTQDIAKIGDADTKLILAEWGLEMKNETAHAAIFDLTTS